MRKAIRLFLEQQMPNYRKPASFLVRESYPLPPYSTVIGMVHNACGFTEYHPMDVSVQGSHASEISDYATMYNFGISYDATRHQAKVPNAKDGYDGINIGPKSVHLLTDVKLLIHIYPQKEEDFDIILEGLKNPKIYLSLGRHEDIVRICEIATVELQEIDEYDEEAEITTKYNMYIPVDLISNGSTGTIYNINKVFGKNEPKKIRTWDETVKVFHIKPDKMIEGKELYYDEKYNTFVCFA